MKTRFLLTAVLSSCLCLGVFAQGDYSPEQLDELLAPIALYPDPLIALMLPAATLPTDLALAASYVLAYGNPALIDTQPWDPSVKGLARYPDVLKWMNDNPEWTQVLGAAFVQQPADVMKSVQQLRTQARAAGNLFDTPQQQVALEGDNLRIVPADPDVIYVPRYDYGSVYTTQVTAGIPGITFGVGYPVGPWLGYQCNWETYGIWVGPWSRGWGYRREWEHPGVGVNSWHAWRPDGRSSRELVRNHYRPQGRLPGPQLEGRERQAARGPVVVYRTGNQRVPSRPDYRGREAATLTPHTAPPPNHLLNGYNRGTQTRDYSNRGQASRTPVTPPTSRPSPPPRTAAPPHTAPPPHTVAPPRSAGDGTGKQQERR